MHTELPSLTREQLTNARSIDFVRTLSCHYEGTAPLEERFPERFPLAFSASAFRQDATLRQKAAVAAGTPSDATWAGPLMAVKPLQAEFVSLVRAASLIGRIPGLRKTPFNVSLPALVTGGTYGWVGSGKVKPVSAASLATVTLPFAKATGILVTTDELMRLNTPGSEAVLRDELVRGAAAFLDLQFIDPTVTAVANVNPASVTSAATPIASSGTSAANANTDVNALVRAFVLANPDVSTAVIVLSPANAMALAATGNYKDLTLTGGFIAGVPAIVTAAAGANIVMLDPTGILVALDDIEVEITKNASIQLDSAPTDPPVAATVEVSLWQLNLVGLKVTAFACWKLTRAAAVQIVTGAAYV